MSDEPCGPNCAAIQGLERLAAAYIRDRRRLAKALRDRRGLADALWVAACRESHAGRRLDADHCEAEGECALCAIMAALRAHGPRRTR